MSRLCQAEMVADDGTTARLSDTEVVGFCTLIGSAGTETLTKLLANAVVLFQRNPSEWDKVVADPGRSPARSKRPCVTGRRRNTRAGSSPRRSPRTA